MRPLGAWHVGNQRHHRHAGRRKFVDRLADAGMVERNHRDAVDLALQPFQRGRQHVAVEDVNMRDADLHALLGEAFRRRAHFLLQPLHERVFARRQDEAEAVVAATGKPRGQAIRAILEQVDGRLDALRRIRVDTGTPVQHAVNGCQADARCAGDIL